MRFEFATAGRILFGAGTLREAGKIARDLGARALVVTGRNAARTEGLLDRLGENGVSHCEFSVAGEPKIAVVEAGVARARSNGCDVVLGMGGGSVLDAGKAIAAMLTNEGELLDYLEVIGRGRTLNRPSAPFVAIPTTAGTGTEVTRNAVLASEQHRVKVSLRSPFLLPQVALIDPELTCDLPPALTASTGLDALTQLIEPYVCLRANPLVDGICLEGLRRAAASLRLAVRVGHNLTAREDMSLASLFGGLALANAGLGAVHGLAGPIGGMFPAPHGAVCAVLLPHVMETNLRALRQRQPEHQAIHRYASIAKALAGNEAASAEDGIAWVRNLVADLQIPRLGVYGIRREHMAELVEKSLRSSSMKTNPVALTMEELSEVLERAL